MIPRELLAEKRGLLEELAREPERAKAEGIPSRIKTLEREIGEALADVPEHTLDSWPLTDDQVQRWLSTRHWIFARTMANNPHEYTLKAVGDERSFELVLLHIRERGYRNLFGSVEYGQLDVGDHFLWSQGNGLETSSLINRKPLSLLERRPPSCSWKVNKITRAKVALGKLALGDALEGPAGPRVERVGEDCYRFTSCAGANRSSEVDGETAARRLARLRVGELAAIRYTGQEGSSQPELEEPSPEPPASPRPPRPSPRRTWTIWARGDGEDTLLASVEGTKADAYVHLMLEQRKIEPRPFVRLRAGTDAGSRPTVSLRSSGWRNEPTAILKQSALYEQVVGTGGARKEEV